MAGLALPKINSAIISALTVGWCEHIRLRLNQPYGQSKSVEEILTCIATSMNCVFHIRKCGLSGKPFSRLGGWRIWGATRIHPELHTLRAEHPLINLVRHRLLNFRKIRAPIKIKSALPPPPKPKIPPP